MINNLGLEMKYSIIIPVYNGEKYIRNCINSILLSKFDQNFEIIVVDDASNDHSYEIAREFELQVIRLKKNQGPSNARNVGALHAKGDILIFIDCDIELFPVTLQQIDDFLNVNSKFVCVSCNYEPNCKMKDAISVYKHLYMCYSIIHHPVSVSWVFTSVLAIYKNIYNEIGGFNSTIRTNEDDLMGRDLIQKGYKLGFGNQIFVNHLHCYSLFSFFREEYHRSKTLMVFKFTTVVRKIKMMKNNNSSSMIISILFFPFLLLSFFLIPINPIIPIISILIFYLINLRFLLFCCTKKDIFYMLKSALVIPIDCGFCTCGIAMGIFKILKGYRI